MRAAAVERAIRLAGLTLPDRCRYEVVGNEPILPSPHYLGTGAAVVRLLTGAAAGELWRLRTGRRQELHVDAAHAAASLRSYLYAHPVDSPRPSPDAGARARGVLRFTRIAAARDGRFVQLHGSFNDGPQLLEELGLDDAATAEDIEAAVAGRDAFELESAFIARRICGGVVRSKQEWAAHPQGAAISEAPVVRITRIGESPPEPLPAGDRPATGIRVIDLTRVLAGPTCAKTLAEHGADVLHISAPHLEGGGPFELETGIGKRQAVVDLRDSDGVAVMRDLVREADVFSQGYRLGTIARRGFSPAQVAELRPGIVYVSENCYGHVGPGPTGRGGSSSVRPPPGCPTGRVRSTPTACPVSRRPRSTITARASWPPTGPWSPWPGG